jgi:hypothetical protein
VSGLSEAEAVGVAPPDLDSLLTDPKKIRELLLQTGNIDQNTLSKIADKDLMLMVNELLKPTSTVNYRTTSPR